MVTNTFNNPDSFGLFVGTTNVWDVSELYGLQNVDPQLQEILVRLYQNLNLMSLVLNIKDSGYYDRREFVTGQLYSPNDKVPPSTFDTSDSLYRQGLRKWILFTALPNATSVQVAHGISITANTTWIKILGAATNPTTLDGIPLPYVSLTPNASIEVDVDMTYVTITTAADYSAYSGEIILEYLQT